ncbi:TetR family transcriptional regulator [Agaricicola taiwanensis]|uniref:TetR family transcriptional regulator n=1 Tax=Agaricicola taiwanensis TaxID=591372 RepID=A0A8J2YF37_9RHOB|nr:TetR/AcrR family transcriptional regulator [Agaricicola taiwanensis]GGE40176.1 TetR family transcriptional regulator [Agaricicola taiwanensis]
MAQAKPTIHDKAIDALMTVLARRDWGEISLADVAREAEVSLADLRAAYPSTGAILGAYVKRIDLAVLKDDSSDLADQPVRERLFDLLMRRLDAMEPHKAAIRRLRRGLRYDPFAAKAWNQLSVTSHQWTLAAAGVTETGALGATKAQVLACAFSSVLDAWAEDLDPGHDRTLRILDEQLGRLERLAEAANGLRQLTAPLRAFCCGSSRRDRSAPGEELSEANAI